MIIKHRLPLACVVAVVVAATPAAASDASRDLRRMIGYTIIDAASVREVAEGGTEKVLALDNGMVFSVTGLILAPLPLTDVIVFGKRLPGTSTTLVKLLVDNEAYDAVLLKAPTRVSAAPPATAPSPPLPPAASEGPKRHRLSVAANDETFVVEGSVFKAKTYCFGFAEGDEIVFAAGGPGGICTSATIVHLQSGKTCEVWCE